MARKKSKISTLKNVDAKPYLKPRIRNYLTTTLAISMLASYLGYFQYGYVVILVYHPHLVPVANLTKEEMNSTQPSMAKILPGLVFFPMGGLVGIVLFANLVDKYGRKFALLIGNTLAFFASVFFCISNITQHLKLTMFASFVTGMSSGMFSCSVPLYLVEISPTPVRGSITTIAALFFSFGLFLATLLGGPKIWGNKESFLLMIALPGTVAAICVVLLLVCPESPRFIFIQKKNEAKAREVLRSLRVQEDLRNEMQELQEEDIYEVMANEKKMTFRKFFRTQKFRWPIFTTFVLMAGSQFSGVNGMYFYIERVYNVMPLPVWIIGVIYLSMHVYLMLVVVISINLIEKWGRRIPIVLGYMICSMICILLTFTLEFQHENYVLCILSLLFINIFLVGYMLGPGIIFLVLLGELFLQSTRALAFTIGYLTMWFSRSISVIILIQLELLLGPYSLLLYWPFCAVTFIYLFKMLPNTKGKTFVEIQRAEPEEE